MALKATLNRCSRSSDDFVDFCFFFFSLAKTDYYIDALQQQQQHQLIA